MFDVEYDYDDTYTTCRLEDRETERELIIRPNYMFDGETVIEGYDGVGKSFVSMAPDELDQLIAELQRARSGCFFGEWPRPTTLFDQDACEGDDTRIRDGFELLGRLAYAITMSTDNGAAKALGIMASVISEVLTDLGVTFENSPHIAEP